MDQFLTSYSVFPLAFSPSYFLLVLFSFKPFSFKHVLFLFKPRMYEMRLRVWNLKRWTKCKAKLSLTSVMRGKALHIQFASCLVKSSTLQLVMALSSFTGQWKFDRVWLYIFTTVKPISTKCISTKYVASWKWECFVESLLLTSIYFSGRARFCGTPDSKPREWQRKYVEQMTGKWKFQ